VHGLRIIGVTGGIGSGKSTVAGIIASHGSPCNEVPVIDADQIAKSVVVKGSKALNEITAYFGKDVLTADGELNRKKLKCLLTLLQGMRISK
jgi:dephospho-CoA kinase